MKTKALFAVLAAAAILFGVSQSADAVIISEDFSSDPGWDGFGNRTDPQDFGFSDTNNAGGTAGEAGGAISRTETAYYADDIGTLDASTDVLTVSGTGVLDGDGNVLVGWFNKDGNLQWDQNAASFLGFRSDDDDLYLFAGGGGDRFGEALSGPFTFEVTWDPDANGGNGTLSGSVNGGTVVTRNLGGGDKDNLEDFNRFGLTNLWIPGNGAAGNMFFDDLNYTSAIPEPSTIVLLACGCLALVAGRRRKMQ